MNKIKQLTAHLRRLVDKGYIVDYNMPNELNTALNQIDIASESQPPLDIEAMAVDDKTLKAMAEKAYPILSIYQYNEDRELMTYGDYCEMRENERTAYIKGAKDMIDSITNTTKKHKP